MDGDPQSVKVAIAYNTSWYIYIFRMNLIRALLARGYQVLTITPRDQYTEKLEAAGCTHVHVALDSRSKNPLKDLRLTLRYIGLLGKHRPDVLLCYTAKPNIYATIASWRRRIPVITNIAGLGTGFVRKSLVTRILRFLYGFSQKRASFVFFQNEDDRRYFTTRRMVRTERCGLLPGSGVDLERFSYDPLRLGAHEDFRFLLVGRMLYSKGVELLVRAAMEISEGAPRGFVVQLLGDVGVDNEDAIDEQTIEEWGRHPRIEYLGRTDDVVPRIAESHCVVLPSYYREGTPRSILEGLAVGRPVITTDMPGCRNTVRHGERGDLR